MELHRQRQSRDERGKYDIELRGSFPIEIVLKSSSPFMSQATSTASSPFEAIETIFPLPRPIPASPAVGPRHPPHVKA